MALRLSDGLGPLPTARDYDTPGAALRAARHRAATWRRVICVDDDHSGRRWYVGPGGAVIRVRAARRRPGRDGD